MTTRLAPIMLAAAVAACSSTTDVQILPGPFTEAATTSIVSSGTGRAVYVTANITNSTGVARTLAWSFDCTGAGALQVRAYRGTASVANAAWDSDKLARTVGCASQQTQSTLGPGESVAIHQFIDVAAILGDSLPADSYNFTVVAKTIPDVPNETAAGTLPLTTAVLDPPATALNGTWAGTANGVTLIVDLTWTTDSVKGTGSYSVSQPNTMGCGVGSLVGTGGLTYTAARTKDHIAGSLLFGNGAGGPPFSGVLVGAGTLAASFMSIDTGPCPITLTLQR